MKYIITLLFTIYSFNAQCQKKELSKAASNGKNQRKEYYVEFKKLYNSNSIETWLNENNYQIYNYQNEPFTKFGDFENGYSKIWFMDKTDFTERIEQERLASIANEKRKKEYEKVLHEQSISEKLVLGGVVILDLFLLYKGVKFAMSVNDVPKMKLNSYNIDYIKSETSDLTKEDIKYKISISINRLIKKCSTIDKPKGIEIDNLEVTMIDRKGMYDIMHIKIRWYEVSSRIEKRLKEFNGIIIDEIETNDTNVWLLSNEYEGGNIWVLGKCWENLTIEQSSKLTLNNYIKDAKIAINLSE